MEIAEHLVRNKWLHFLLFLAFYFFIPNFLFFPSINMTNYNIIQWNCRGFRTNFEELQQLTTQYNPALFCLQESNMLNSSQIKLKNYTHFHTLHTSILIHNSIPFTYLPTSSPFVTAARVTLHRPINVCSLYFPPKYKLTLTELETIFSALPSPCMILGDFNGAHPLWGSSSTNPRGTIIDHFITEHLLSVLNDKSPTYLSPTYGTFSAIDLSIVDPTLFLDFTWSVINDQHGSDHFPILLSSLSPLPSAKTPHWQIHKADWPDFNNLCEEKLCDLPLNENVAEHFSEILLDIAHTTIPQSSGQTLPPRKPWFTLDCKNAIRDRHRSLRKFKRSPTTDNLILYKRQRAQTRYVLKTARKNSWKKYVSSLNSHTSMKSVWKTLRSMQGKNSPPPVPNNLLVSNIQVTELPDITNTLASQFSLNSSTDNCTPTFLKHKTLQEQYIVNFKSHNHESYNMPFSIEELHTSLS